jgi:hypothetical protein
MRSTRSRRPSRTVPLQVTLLEERCVPAALTVDGSQHFQTITGLGTNLSSEAWNGGAVIPSLNTLLSHGYQTYRVIVEPVQGWEDTNPNTGPYSDSNPNWPFYNNLYGTSTKFTNLWNTIGYLNNHGATVILNLQSDAPAWMTDPSGASGSMGPDHEADWATMVSTLVDYAVNTAHVRIDALGPMNEPDNPGDPVQGPQVDATQYVRMMDTLETQLQGYGLGGIPLVGPDTASAGNAVNSYVPAMLADPFLMPHVLQFGFHTYGGSVSDPDITNNTTYPGRTIISDEYDGPYYNEDHGQRATAAQLWTQADASFQNLMSILNAGENGAIIWDGVDNFYEYYQQWSAHGLISYDWTAPDPTAPSDYGTTVRLFANAQVFQFVHPGDIVIGASDTANNFIEAAFLGPSTGAITIAGENTGTSATTLTGHLTGGLGTNLFNYYLTNRSLNEQQQADVAVNNNTFTFTVPADTIFTLTTPTAPRVTGVTPISGLTTGGQSVTIDGNGFRGVTGVSFDTVAATSFTINSDSQITAVTPALAAGTVDVTVAYANGSSATSSADQFQVVTPDGTAPPTVATAASATLNGNQTAAALSVQGASQYGARTLTYTWAVLGTPPAPVSFNINGNNSASNVTASFTQAGTYNFQVTIADPAGNTAASTTSVTVGQVATTLTVSPASGAVVPGGSLQFTDTATDQFGNPYTTTPVSWSVSGGGTIDATGTFTAGSATGGPFTVTAAVGGISATASVTVSTNVNVAPNGTTYRWYGMSSDAGTTNQTAAPALNDGNLTADVTLTGSGDDVANAFEAAGVLWTTAQSINRVTFTNGSFNASSYDGVFDNNLGLQVTTDGVTWSAVSGWLLSPAYPYNVPAAASQTYTFTGGALSVRGVRVVGEVHSRTGNDSWYDNATEVQAFATPATLAISPTTLPGGTANQSYQASFTASNGSGNYTFSVSSGSLPPNLTLTPAGVLGGTPTTAGSYTFTIQASDTNDPGLTGTRQYTLTVAPAAALTLGPQALPLATAKDAYGPLTFSATGGYGSYTFALATGSTLPAGLTLTSGGILRGTPTVAGTYTFTITVKDKRRPALTGSEQVTLTVNPAITVMPATLPAATVTNAYSRQFLAAGGSGMGYNFAIAPGSSLPEGLTLTSAGLLSGTPTVSGRFTFTVLVTDSNGATGRKTYTLLIDPALTISPTSLPPAQVGTPYSEALTAAGGSGTGYVFKAHGLPTWLKLSSTGVLSGTPPAHAPASVTFTILVTDSKHGTVSEQYTLTIDP